MHKLQTGLAPCPQMGQLDGMQNLCVERAVCISHISNLCEKHHPCESKLIACVYCCVYWSSITLYMYMCYNEFHKEPLTYSHVQQPCFFMLFIQGSPQVQEGSEGHQIQLLEAHMNLNCLKSSLDNLPQYFIPAGYTPLCRINHVCLLGLVKIVLGVHMVQIVPCMSKGNNKIDEHAQLLLIAGTCRLSCSASYFTSSYSP